MDLLEQKRNQRWLIGQRIIAKVGQALDDLFCELAIEQVTADVTERTPSEGDEFDSEINRMENSDWGDRWLAQRQRVEQAVRKVVPTLPRTRSHRR